MLLEELFFSAENIVLFVTFEGFDCQNHYRSTTKMKQLQVELLTRKGFVVCVNYLLHFKRESFFILVHLLPYFENFELHVLKNKLDKYS